MPLLHQNDLTISDFFELLDGSGNLELSAEVREEIRLSREFLEKKIQTSEHPIYGINTGFGELCRQEIPASDLDQL